MLNKAKDFLNQLFSQLSNLDIQLHDWTIDHLCYRSSSLENYLEIKKYFSKYGELLIESEVNGRDIATYKLFDAISYNEFVIPLVEVPAPKVGKITVEGWEHVEVIIDISFDKMIKRHKSLNFDTKALSKKINPELVLKLNNCSIKFHHQSLEEVIKNENEVTF